MDSIKHHAQGINTHIDRQHKLLEKLHTRVDNSWGRLEKKNSDLKTVLDKYRNANGLCCDICLVIMIVVLAGLALSIFKEKGYF